MSTNYKGPESQKQAAPGVDQIFHSSIRFKNEYEIQQGMEVHEYRTLSNRWYYLSIGLLVLSILFRQPLFAVLGLLLTLVLAMIDIWSRYCLRHVSYQRVLGAKRALFGEQITLSIVIENAKILPLPWLETEDGVPGALEFEDQDLRSNSISNMLSLDCLFSLRWYDRVTRRYTLRCITRGMHSFGPTKLRSGDVLGFVNREVELPNYQYVLIYPLIVPISDLNLPARHPFGEQRAPRRLLEDPARVVGVRDFVYGDSLRRVNWKATARTMQMQSKVYETSTTYNLVMFLNTAARHENYYGIQPELQELSICTAASLTDWAVNQNYAVGLYANGSMYMPDEPHNINLDEGDPEETETDKSERLEATVTALRKKRRISVPASRSVTQRQRIMEILARVQPFFGTSIEEVLQTERAHLPSGATVVVITTTVSDRLVDTLARIRQGGHAVCILFVGDSPIPIRIAGVTVYHIGGEARWNSFVTAYSNRTVQGSANLPSLRM